jgi:ubiquinone/menaquinone biosynthesis C-methylase UbiE
VQSLKLINFGHERYIHRRRVSRLVNLLAEFIPPDARVLDVGCGDGRLARSLAGARPDISIEGIDVVARDQTCIPVTVFDGTSIPFAESAFDIVMFIDVLHHALDPILLLREATRIASHGIVIKDHLVRGVLDDWTLRVMDWIGNARHGVALPYNYWTYTQWRRVFGELELEICRWETHLRLYPLPADWVFGRSLHFMALLQRCASKSDL